MKCTILGTKYSKFVNDNNELIESFSLFVTHKNPRNNDFTTFTGRGVSVVKCPLDFRDRAVEGAVCDLDFDANGKLLDIDFPDD